MRIQTHTPLPGRSIETLDLESLPRGSLQRLWLKLGSDSLGKPWETPVLVLRGQKPGPVLGLSAAVHGDELNGIRVLHELFQSLATQKIHGTLVAALVVNVPGYLRGIRAFTDGKDLNLRFPGVDHGNESHLYAYRFTQAFLPSIDALIDLHTASKGRVNSLYIRADLSDPKARELAFLLNPQIILHNPPSDHTLRGTAAEMGLPAITVEIGDPSRFQADYVHRTLMGLKRILRHLGILPGKLRPPKGPEPTLCVSSEWTYTDQGGFLQGLPELGAILQEGDLLARLSTPFGDPLRTYHTSSPGVVIGKAVNPSAPAGARIVHLGKLASSQDSEHWPRTIDRERL